MVRRHRRRLPTFLGVGALGLLTTFLGTVLLYRQLHLPLWLASAVAIQTAILVTFSLNSLITWRDRRGRGRGHRFVIFEGVSLVGLGINEAVLLTSVDRFHVFYLLALVLGSGAAAVWNYLANHNVTFASA